MNNNEKQLITKSGRTNANGVVCYDASDEWLWKQLHSEDYYN